MFKIGLTRDFLTPEGSLSYKTIGLETLDAVPGVEYEFLKEHHSPVTPEMIDGYDVIISLAPAYNASSFTGVKGLKAICRFGVGYDMVDVKACTDANVMLTITRGAVNHSVSEAIIGWMLALSHKMFQKDKLVRDGKWAERSRYTGSEIRNKTLGIIGIGGIGSTLVDMLKPFHIARVLAFDPHADASRVAAMGVELTDLKTMMAQSDFVSINCPLTEETRNLVKAEELSLLKKSAFLINTARGGIINGEALLNILKNEQIAGYATDVFDDEPPNVNDELFSMKNVIMAPHCIAWTNELFEEIGQMACRQAVQVYNKQTPDHLVNPEVLK